MANEQNLRPPWKPGESGNLAGKPKGSKHLSSWIQEMMNDETFEIFLADVREGYKKYEGAPIKAIVMTAMKRAASGDKQWADWLAVNGWKQQLDITSDGDKLEGLVIIKNAEK